MSVRVPGALRPGRHELHLRGPDLDAAASGAPDIVLQIGSGGDQQSSEEDSAEPASGPTSMDDLRAQFAALGRYDGLAGAFTGGHGRFAAYRDPDVRIGGSASVAFTVAK
jgi:hypothetical protein